MVDRGSFYIFFIFRMLAQDLIVDGNILWILLILLGRLIRISYRLLGTE